MTDTLQLRKEQIEAQLRPLIGLKLSSSWVFLQIRYFGFGDESSPEIELQIRGAWRIETETELWTGKADVERWKYESRQPFHWNSGNGASLQQAIIGKIFNESQVEAYTLKNRTDHFVVDEVACNSFGDVWITLSGGYTLTVFADSKYRESWRVAKPISDEPDFIINNLDKTREFEPVTVADYLYRAELIFETNPHQTEKLLRQSIEDCEAALRLDSNNSMAYCRRGKYQDALETSEGTRAALEDYNKAIRLDPRNHEAYIRRALILEYDLNDYVSAIEDYSKVIELKPKRAFTYASRATVYSKIGNHKAALSDLNRAIELKPEAETYLQRSKTHQAMSNVLLALADLDTGIDFKSEDAEVLYRERANLRYNMGDIEVAMTDYADAIKLHSTDAETYNARAWTLYLQAKYIPALADANLAVKYGKDESWRYLHTRGAIYAATAQVVRAVCDYQQALDLKPDDPEIEQEMTDYIARWVRV